jgi:hypothetical protein
MRKKHKIDERRRYIRLKSIFPVEFQILQATAEKVISEWIQGYTSNVSIGGICLTVNNLDDKTLKYILDKNSRLLLNIHIPLRESVSSVIAKVVWLQKIKSTPLNQYSFGLEFEQINNKALKRIIHCARWNKFLTDFSLYLIILLTVAVGSISVYNLNLKRKNRQTVNKLINTIQEVKSLEEQLVKIREDKTLLEKKMIVYRDNITELEENISNTKQLLAKETLAKRKLKKKIQSIKENLEQLKENLNKTVHEKAFLEARLSDLTDRENYLSEHLDVIENNKAILQQATVDQMYHWLKTHQSHSTGLVISFEGDVRLNDWAFTYDQALVIQVFVLFGDYQRAEKILNFYNRKIDDKFKGFVNAYYASLGKEAENIIHSGPNIWLGIAILQYTIRTKNEQYLPLARQIADWIISLQEMDPEGGIKGGPRVHWYSTEHNLDAFAFFNMMYEVTHQEKYELAARKVLNWLVAYAYEKKIPPIKRGKGDATIATDTYAWSIAAVGPEKLRELDMDPDQIIKFAEDNCGVEVEYVRPDGKTIIVKGFDFAKYYHLPRGGVISTEWTAQMILAFKIMQQYYTRNQNILKAKYYEDKAEDYLNELANLIISSPSPTGQGYGCLPYATEDDIDTGHGWRTPRGKSTGSVAATAYAIFAQKGFNPLKIEN